MKKIFKQSLILLICLFSFSIFTGNELTAFADNATTPNTNDSICNNNNISIEARRSFGCNVDANVKSLPNVIQNILNSIIFVSGTIAVIFVIIGGINYMTSTGDPNKTEKGKKTILYACIGLVISALAFAIVNWVISIIP